MLCRLNVIEQVTNVCRTTIVQEAWERGQPLLVHGVVYGLDDGMLRDLEVTTGRSDDVGGRRAQVVARLAAGISVSRRGRG